MKNLEDYITIIIRSVGERTEDLCYRLINKQISSKNIHIVNEKPFTNAIEKTFDIGIEKNRKWTLVIDADVLIKPKIIEEMFKEAESKDNKIFGISGKIIDKFLCASPRLAGNHLYRTKYLEEAKKFIPSPNKAIRPETYTKEKMESKKRLWESVPIVVGFHDYEQYYKDIYRKCFTHSKKFSANVSEILAHWKKESKEDEDFRVALMAFKDGKKYKKNIAIDANAKFMNNFENKLKKIELKEKKPIKKSKFLDDIHYFNYLIKELEKSNNILKESKSYRIGSFIFFFPSKLKNFIRLLFKGRLGTLFRKIRKKL